MRYITPVAIAVIYDYKTNKFLLTKRKGVQSEDKEFGECWNFPGGGIQFKEDPINALHREIKEELNIEIQITSLIPHIFSPVRENWHGLLICYLCKIEKAGQTITLNEESKDYGWFTLEEIKKLNLLPLGYEIATQAIKQMSLP